MNAYSNGHKYVVKSLAVKERFEIRLTAFMNAFINGHVDVANAKCNDITVFKNILIIVSKT